MSQRARARVPKRHRLPPRRDVPGEAACRDHLEPLLLFCEDDQVTLCRQCFLAQEHRSHVVRGVYEAAEKYRVSCLQAPQPFRLPLSGINLFVWATGAMSLQDQPFSTCGS